MKTLKLLTFLVYIVLICTIAVQVVYWASYYDNAGELSGMSDLKLWGSTIISLIVVVGVLLQLINISTYRKLYRAVEYFIKKL